MEYFHLRYCNSLGIPTNNYLGTYEDHKTCRQIGLNAAEGAVLSSVQSPSVQACEDYCRSQPDCLVAVQIGGNCYPKSSFAFVLDVNPDATTVYKHCREWRKTVKGSFYKTCGLSRAISMC